MNLQIKDIIITAIASAVLAAAMRLLGLAPATTFALVLAAAAVIYPLLVRTALPRVALLMEGIVRGARFRTISETVPDLIAQLTPEGKWRYASPSHKTVLGYDSGWLLGKSILDFVHPDDRRLVAAITENPANNPVGPRVEARIRHAAGHYLCVECEGSPLLDAHGVRSTILVGRDITEHKRADEALSHRLALEQAVTHVATSLMAEKEPDPRAMLAVLAQALPADRAWILLARQGGGGLDLAYWWPEDGMEEGQRRLTYDLGAIGWVWEALCNNESVVISHVAALPGEASSEREIMQEQGLCSAVAIPLSCAGETLGMMGFGDTSGAREWPGEDVRLLRAVCEMMAGNIKRDRSEEALRESEERYRFLIENQDEGIVMLDLNEGFTFANPAAIEMFGSPSGGLVGRNLREFTDPANFNVILNNTKMRWQGLKTTYEIEIEASDGRKRILLLTGSPRVDSHGKLVGTFGIFRDITEQKQAEAKIRYLSFHDKLTGLYNRAYFEEELRRINGQRQMPISIIMGDVNGLKLVNDAFGHHEGDRILVEIAQVLKASCRQEDVVARWGGDEFVIVLPRCAQKTAMEVCDRIRQSCRRCGGTPLQLSIALGAVTKEDTEESVSDILKEAEDRMYRNKLLESKSTRSFIFHSLQKTLRERSHETEEHAQRLKETAARIGRVLGLSDSKMDELSLLATLHDIGKIAIPDSILLKPSGLSAEEWLTVRRHPEIGYRIAASSPEMAPIAEAILSHHERWDGMGYPQGLKGDQIPLISRVIAVADAYDAMTHRSQYREPMDREAAVAEIRRNAGTQFDPEVVRAFLKAFARPAS